jgi:hypothetical protein
MAICRVCKVELVKDVNWSKGIYKEGQRICRKCHAEKSRRYTKAHPERLRKSRKLYRKKYGDRLRKTHREKYAEVRLDVLTHYSGSPSKCSCCGEDNIKFLTIDHINNNGAKDRKKHRSTWAFFIWIKKNNYPEGLQILCYNCNMGRAYNDGVCPHKE